MFTAVKCIIFLFAFSTPSLAHDGSTIDNKHTERVSVAEAEKTYASACAVVQRDFDTRRSLHPQVRLVLGADKNVVFWDVREIRLTRWNPYLFAQGVVNAGLRRSHDLGPKNSHDETSRDLGRFSCGN